MSQVEFEDYSAQVKAKLNEKSIAFLHEVGGEIRSQAQRNSRRRTSQTAGSFQYQVDESNLSVHIGSDYWNAVFEEFGTGEFAIKGDGRKGYWIFVDTHGQPQAPKGGKTYTLEEAKRIVAMLRSKGLDAYYTKGKKPSRALFNAFESMKGKIQRVAEQYFGDL